MTSERELITKIKTEAERLAQAAAAAEFWHGRGEEAAQVEYEQEIARLNAADETARTAATQEYDKALEQTKSELAQVTRDAGLWRAPWKARAWRDFAPPRENTVPPLTRIGKLTERGQYEHPDGYKQIRMPALVPFVGGRNLLIMAQGAAKDHATEALQAVMLRLLATLPPGKLRFTLIDPVGLGDNVAGFFHLPDELTGGKAWTEANHIEQQLAKLKEHTEMVIQKYLLNRYETMEEYNQEAGEVAEAYHVLVVANFPVNFTEDAARRLVSIASSGPRTGVYLLATVDTAAKMPYNFNLDDLTRTATVIAARKRRFRWEDADFGECRLTLDTPPATEQFNQIVQMVGEAAITASTVQVPFAELVPPRAVWWQEDTRAAVHAPIGKHGAQAAQNLVLDSKTWHNALLIGRPGSGKSTLLHVLITSLALTYAPSELELYLVDFKEGVEFKDYADYALPHARVVAIESEREFGLSVLRRVDAEMTRRGELFRAASCESLKAYRDKTGAVLPRLLLIVDEFQELFTTEDKLEAEAQLLLDRLIRKGRAFGIHTLLATQTLAGQYTLAASTKNQVPIRIALSCSDTDSRLIFSDDNAAARSLTRPGAAIYNSLNGLVEGNEPFQVLWLDKEVRRTEYLAQVQELARARRYTPPHPQIVFEGNKPARVESNTELRALMDAPAWAAPPRRAVAWLGEPIEIKPHTAARFRRQSCTNLLIVGQDEEAGAAMLTTALASLVAQHAPGTARFYVLDLSRASMYEEVARREQYEVGTIKLLTEALPHDIIRTERRREAGEVVNDIAALVAERVALEDEAVGAPAYFVVIGLHLARDLRRDEDMGYGYGSGYGDPDAERPPRPPSPFQQFLTICRDGPEVGVHTLVWCNTYANLKRTLTREGIAEFDLRVALPMGLEDSEQLISSPAASKLGQYRAVLYDEERVGELEKFRPYRLPSTDWIRAVGRRLEGKER